MRNVDHALDVLREIIGLDRLELKDGTVSLQMAGQETFTLVKISDTEIELTTLLDDLGTDLSAPRLTELLKANYIGHGTGAGRIAIDPRDGMVIYCTRLDVTKYEARDLEQAVVTFLKYTMYWDGPGTDGILAVRDVRAPGPIDTPPVDEDLTTFIRL